jgi:hypothetical protein
MCTQPARRAVLIEIKKLRQATRLTCAKCGRSVSAANISTLYDDGWRVVDKEARCCLDHNLDLSSVKPGVRIR